MTEFQEFVDSYYAKFISTLTSFDRSPLPGVLEVLDQVINAEGTLWVAGNGGSAAISNHAVCDLTKWTYTGTEKSLRCHSLASNVPMLTALGNDIGFDQVFSRQLTYYVKPTDALLLVSSSGNSPNVVKACELANASGIPTIAFVGFKGGRLKDLANHTVWIPVENYGIVEDAHQSLMHVLTQYIRVRADERAAKAP